MKRLLLLCLLAASLSSPAQHLGGATTNAAPGGGGGGTPIPTAPWQRHADSLFQYIDRSPVSTGLLANYGFAFKDYNQFQGTTLTTANLLQHLGEWRLLYGAMQSSVFNTNATLFPLSTANFRIRQVQHQTGTDVVPIATLLTRYDRFRDDAGTAGLVTVSNGQLHDAPNRPYSPYEQRTLLSLCPLTSHATTRTPNSRSPRSSYSPTPRLPSRPWSLTPAKGRATVPPPGTSLSRLPTLPTAPTRCASASLVPMARCCSARLVSM